MRSFTQTTIFTYLHAGERHLPSRSLAGRAKKTFGVTLLALTMVMTLTTMVRVEPLAAIPLCLAGSGTSLDPFLVSNATDLAKVGSGVDGCDADKDYLQTAHITLNPPSPGSSNHTPIANFTGSYDGGGFTITGVTIESSAAKVGLFGSTTNAVIRRVHLVEASITATGTGSTGSHGGLIGHAIYTVVTDASFDGTVTSSGDNAGGLIGNGNSSSVRNSFSQGFVTGAKYVGGLIGYVPSGGVDASFSTAHTTTTSSLGAVGGLIGYLPSNTHPDLFVAGSITATSSLGTSIVSGDRFDFGFTLDTMTPATSAGDGGAAFNNAFAVSNFRLNAAASNTGTWEPDDISWDLKNLVGNANGDNLTLQMEASSGAPDLDGFPFFDVGISLDWAQTDVDMVHVAVGDALATFLGTSTPPLEQASAFVEIRNQAGPFQYDSPTFTSTLFALDGFVRDVYARGDVTHPGTLGEAGGLIGYAPGGFGVRLDRAYATGFVQSVGDTDAGGLIGFSSSAVVSDAFWDADTTQQLFSAGGTGKTTPALKTPSTFTDTTLFGLSTAWPLVTGQAPYVYDSTVWGICTEVNAGYPFLLWQADANRCGTSSASADRPAPIVDPTTGRPPVQATGQVSVLVGGAPAPVTVTANPNSAGRRGGVSVTGENFDFALSPIGDLLPRDLDPFTLPKDAGVAVESSGFQPGAPVFVWLFSTPHLLGEFAVDANGNLAATIDNLPENVSACPHTVQVSSRLANGLPIVINLGVWATANPFPFTDMNVTDTHARAVGCLHSLGVANGFEANSYRQTEALRRGQAATMLTRLRAFHASETSFSDVAGTTHAPAIGALEAAKVMAGFGDGTFKPDAPMTRGQFATVLTRTYGLSSQTAPFTDAGTTHSGALGALHAAGVVTGFTDGSVRADEPITRGQAASMLVRAQRLS